MFTLLFFSYHFSIIVIPIHNVFVEIAAKIINYGKVKK